MSKSFYGMLLCALSVAACSTPVPLQDRLLEHDAEINEVIARMTLEEKVEMLHSKTNMSSRTSSTPTAPSAYARRASPQASSPPDGSLTPPPTSPPAQHSPPPGLPNSPTSTAPAWGVRLASGARTSSSDPQSTSSGSPSAVAPTSTSPRTPFSAPTSPPNTSRACRTPAPPPAALRPQQPGDQPRHRQRRR